MKISCKNEEKNRNSCNPLQNHVPVKNSSGKRRKKRNPQESWQERLFCPKNKFLKTGITNLVNWAAADHPAAAEDHCHRLPCYWLDDQ